MKVYLHAFGIALCALIFNLNQMTYKESILSLVSLKCELPLT